MRRMCNSQIHSVLPIENSYIPLQVIHRVFHRYASRSHMSRFVTWAVLRAFLTRPLGQMALYAGGRSDRRDGRPAWFVVRPDQWLIRAV